MKAEKTEKTDRKEQVQELTKKLEDGITALFESDRYLEYLTIMAVPPLQLPEYTADLIAASGCNTGCWISCMEAEVWALCEKR